MPTETDRLIPTETQMRRAIAERDASYDHIFVYAVVTTGVFCLPSCKARPARPENVRFFLDHETAAAAGFRPCKRCRPLAAFGERAELLELARWMQANPDTPVTVKTLAERAGMTPARLRNRFKAFFGVTPKDFRNSRQLEGFKAALSRGVSVTEAIYDAGFGSTSRLHGVITRSIGMTPKAYRSGGTGETLHFAFRTTVIGGLLMAATTRGVCFAQFGDDEASLLDQLQAEFPNADIVRSSAQKSPELDRWIAALDEHVSSHGPRPDVPLDLRGTAFQIAVWKYLLSVPAGEVVSYAEVADAIHRPNATRAAANACGANRVAVLVPCHRVLRGDGGIGGYRWGVERKRTLIAAERHRQDGRR